MPSWPSFRYADHRKWSVSRSIEQQQVPQALANLGGAFGIISKLPRPKSVRISIPPGEQLDPRAFYAAISRACKAKPIAICKNNYNDVIVTFKTVEESQRLLKLPSISLEENGTKFGIFDPVTPIVYVQVNNIPYELSDHAVARKLSVYGEVLSCRRGHHLDMPTIENGV